MALSLSEATVGCRIESDGFYGTIRYIGNVPSTNGTWYGVEWDDVTRGKHDGCFDGVRYFSTTGGPKCASFLRPSKCRTGEGFMRATLERYGGVDDEEMYVEGGPGRKQTAVVMVGAEKINRLTSQLRLLRHLCLRENFIRSTDKDFTDISCPLPNVLHLDLSLNLFTSWDEIFKIISFMPNLEELNVSGNRIAPLSQSVALSKVQRTSFASVKVLYLNRMEYTWKDIVSLLPCFASVQTLHACYNRVTHISGSIKFDKITLLNLEGNALEGWSQVLQLNDVTPNTETLILNSTGIEKIYFPGDGKTTEHFLRLNSMSVNDNRIDSWSCLNELNRLPSLTSLRFSGNPLMEQVGAATAHHIAVAKLGGLRRCNGTAVTATERRGAELDYLKSHGLRWKTAVANKTEAEFRTEHPRYLDIVAKYGAPEDSELKEQASSALKNSLIKINISCPNMPSNLPCTKKVPISMTIQKLKILVQRLYSVRDIQSIRLTYSSHKHTTPAHSSQITLDNDLKEIGFYSIEDQDNLYVCW